MCPLRLILVFLSATLAGFFLFRNLRSNPEQQLLQDHNNNTNNNLDKKNQPSLPLSSKIISAFTSGFWTCIDMASGRYLWRNLTSASKDS